MQTKLYRVALIAFNLATAIVGSITAWGPGIGLDLETIGLITTVGNIVIVVARQIQDATTPTIPSTGSGS